MPDLAALDDVFKIAVPTVTAALLGGLFTLLPARMKRLRTKRKGIDMLKAQVLFCTAGAMLVVVIGSDQHSAARAFGLLGLGSFIRFRTVLKNPTDTAVFFILIGIGMACGLGRPAAALFGTLFLMLLLTVLERFAPQPAAGDTSSKDGDD